MELRVTQLSTAGVPGRRYPANPSIFQLIFRLFAERTADKVFVDPITGMEAAEFGVTTQFAQVADIGVALIVQFIKQSDGTPFDISAASEIDIIIGQPDGLKFTKVGQLVTDGIDGKAYYVTLDGDLPISGIYSIQGKANFVDEFIRSEVLPFEVLENIEATNPGPVPDPHVGTFTAGDLVGNRLTINHYEGLVAPFSVIVSIFDSAGHQVTPDAITGFENSVQIDLTSFGPIAGDWGYVYQ